MSGSYVYNLVAIDDIIENIIPILYILCFIVYFTFQYNTTYNNNNCSVRLLTSNITDHWNLPLGGRLHNFVGNTELGTPLNLLKGGGYPYN